MVFWNAAGRSVNSAAIKSAPRAGGRCRPGSVRSDDDDNGQADCAANPIGILRWHECSTRYETAHALKVCSNGESAGCACNNIKKANTMLYRHSK